MRIYSAVVDNEPEFYLQVDYLIWSLVHLAHVKKEQIHILFTDKCPDYSLHYFRDLGVHVSRIESFEGNKYCNKLCQLDYLEGVPASEYALLDCDTIILESPPNIKSPVSGRQVDLPNPPYDICQKIFDAADLTIRDSKCSFDDSLTPLGNFNGGLYLIQHKFFHSIAKEWKRWAAWSIENVQLFSVYAKHIDQVSFSLALHSLDIVPEVMSNEFNFPIHLSLPNRFDCYPKSIHYHRQLDQHCLLDTSNIVNLRNVSNVVEVLNAKISLRKRFSFCNEFFWDYRYKFYPELGSGLGSRDLLLSFKSELIDRVLKIFSATVVADIACGDGFVTDNINPNITQHGFDISASSKDIYLKGSSNRKWTRLDIRNQCLDRDYDLVLFLDVLIHLASESDYQHAIQNVLLANNVTLISGYEQMPMNPGDMTFYYEPLSKTISNLNMIPIPIHDYRELRVFLCLSPDHLASLISSSLAMTFVSALPFIRNPLKVLEYIVESIDSLGFFPNHLPRFIEYDWIFDNITKSSGIVVDAGAGVNILPIVLSNVCERVITVDPHRIIRKSEHKDQWNEWGFLDYSQFSDNIISFNLPFEDVVLDHCHTIYSVSVIEHLSREVRLHWLKKMNSLLVLSGHIILTVDTEPYSSNLWNYSEGLIVDERDHGTVSSFRDEIVQSGFTIEQFEHIPWLPESRVGMLKVKASKELDLLTSEKAYG